MKHSTNIVERHSHSRSSTFSYLCAESDEQRFNVLPWDVGSLRSFEYDLESASVFRLHRL